MIKQKIQLRGLTCGACVKLAQKRLQRIDDVVRVEVMVSGEAEIVSARQIGSSEIKQALFDTPYSLA